VVAGADDQVTPPALAEELARGIAGARLEVIPQAGHQAPLEQADAFNRLVGGFAPEAA
jgi:pimeloyl-ACP methyl ester carboxylesterase